MRTLVIILIAVVLVLGVVGCKSHSKCGCDGPCILGGSGPCAEKVPAAKEYRTGIQCDYCTHDICNWYCR